MARVFFSYSHADEGLRDLLQFDRNYQRWSYLLQWCQYCNNIKYCCNRSWPMERNIIEWCFI